MIARRRCGRWGGNTMMPEIAMTKKQPRTVREIMDKDKEVDRRGEGCHCGERIQCG